MKIVDIPSMTIFKVTACFIKEFFSHKKNCIPTPPTLKKKENSFLKQNTPYHLSATLISITYCSRSFKFSEMFVAFTPFAIDKYCGPKEAQSGTTKNILFGVSGSAFTNFVILFILIGWDRDTVIWKYPTLGKIESTAAYILDFGL